MKTVPDSKSDHRGIFLKKRVGVLSFKLLINNLKDVKSFHLGVHLVMLSVTPGSALKNYFR